MLSALTVVTPPVQDLVTVDQARKHCRIDNTLDDDLLAGFIAVAVSLAETFLSRALLTQTLRWVMMETPPAAVGVAVPGLFTDPGGWLGFPHALQRPILLPRSPVQQVLQVAVGDPQGGPDQVLDPSCWVADTELEPSRLRLLQGSLNCPMRHLAVEFVAGYGDTPASVPPPIRLALLLMVAWLYENRGDSDGEMPLAAERLMWPCRMVGFGG